jgi:hypothetical protein
MKIQPTYNFGVINMKFCPHTFAEKLLIKDIFKNYEKKFYHQEDIIDYCHWACDDIFVDSAGNNIVDWRQHRRTGRSGGGDQMYSLWNGYATVNGSNTPELGQPICCINTQCLKYVI